VKPRFRRVHLWDGALYDNLGTEALVKPGGSYRDDLIDFLIVSDASPSLSSQCFRWGFQWKRSIYDITANQSQSLRTRDIVGRLQRGDMRGAYFKIGRSASDIVQKAGQPVSLLQSIVTLSNDDVQLANSMGLSIGKLSNHEFDCLFRHAFEVANYTLHVHNRDLFPVLISLS
jgi:NTE family protein